MNTEGLDLPAALQSLDDGTLEVETAVGVGTTFVIRLPQEQAGTEA